MKRINKKNEPAIPSPGGQVFTSDAPANDPKQDRFGRFPFAQRVAQTLARREDPSSIVVAIHGAWGEGKTTVLAYIELALRSFYPGVVCVRFNPWRFGDEATLLRSFFDTVADGLKRSLKSHKERVGKVLQEYGKLASISLELNDAKVSVGEGLAELGVSWSTISLDDKKLKVEQILREEGRQIVVLIDDIDRLERAEVRQIFRLVKLTADFEYMSYVLAFDPVMVAGALGEAYGTGAAKDGQSFLEKIVQVPLDLPAAEPEELQEYCFDHVNEALRVAQVQLPAEARQEFELEFDQYFTPVLGTPRAAKRYANSLAFIMPLLAGEVNPCDVMLLEAIKVFHPSVYAAIRRAPERFTGSSRARDDGEREKANLWMQEVLAGEPVVERLILRLFPLVRNQLRGGSFDSGEEVEWARQQRVASRDYLRRYLACSVVRGDIPDRRVDELLAQIGGLSEQSASDRLLAFMAEVHPRGLLWKLRVRVKQMDEQLARHLALVIARSGDGIPGPTEKDTFFSPLSSAAFLIRTLLARVEEPSARLVAARVVLATSRPLTFAHLCFQSMRSQDEGLDFLAQGVGELGGLLGDRIAEFAASASLWRAYPIGIHWMILLLHWQKNRGSEELHAYYRRTLESDPQEGVALVRSQLGVAVPGPFVNDFQAGHYENLALLADPKDVCRALAVVDRSKIAPTDAKLLKQFEAIYEQRQEGVVEVDTT